MNDWQRYRIRNWLSWAGLVAAVVAACVAFAWMVVVL